ncbi:hypothetical protein [Carboxylicivirga marina]|uniref:Transposase n=1 Tax=Carboxylicivirga marina TaxID=2800988 RepID=A0ABS1HJH8_9BACT|nr:hypothetical protein [Carboxylicivirga marina]MBK3517702.1 hypothetical protein [Carboxylicivirga marina]
METYSQFIEQLAEWFMQLFFDPAYHFTSDDKPKKGKKRKVETLMNWLKKQGEKVKAPMHSKIQDSVSNQLLSIKQQAYQFVSGLRGFLSMQEALVQWIH